MCPAALARYDQPVETRDADEMGRRDEQLVTVAAIATSVAVGIGLFLFQGSERGGIEAAHAIVAWVAFSLFLAALIGDVTNVATFRRARGQVVVVATLVVAGIALRLAVPAFEWSAVLFVISAAGAAYVLPSIAVAGVVVVQTVVVAAASTLAGVDPASIGLTTLVYLMFQAFATQVVGTAMREAAGRRALAATNAELSVATTLLSASSRDAERLRIARDLHDVVGHQLTALALELEIAGHLVTDGPARDHVERARTITKDLLADIRDVVTELREAPQGLEATLRPMLSALPGLAVELEVREERPIDETRAVVVVRFVQEVATNALRHAAASHLAVRIVSDDAGLWLEARDDGVGARSWQMGHGLTGMEERFAQLGGEVTFDPNPGGGFGVVARLPSA